jgi:hypothetical protein
MKKEITKGLCGLLMLWMASGCAPRKTVKTGFPLEAINEFTGEKWNLYNYVKTENGVNYFESKDGKKWNYSAPEYTAQKDDLLLKNEKKEVRILRKTEDDEYKTINTWDGKSTEPDY